MSTTIKSNTSGETGPKRVVIIGGGPAGVQTYHHLHALLAKSSVTTTLTLVSVSEAYFNNSGAPRAIANPKIPVGKLLRPLSQLFVSANGKDLATRGNVTGRLVIAKVTEAWDQYVRTTGSADPDDAVILYDFLVVALGSRYSQPFKGQPGVPQNTIDYIGQVAKRVAAPETHRILILGCGIVAVETAAEIKSAHPDKTVTIAGPQLLATAPVAFAERVRSILAKLQVNVIEGVTADTAGILVNASSTTASEYPISKPNMPVSLTPIVGAPPDTLTCLVADMVFTSTGIEPNSDPFRLCASWPLTPRGYLRVSSTMEVVGHDNVFALGDICEVEPASTYARKLATYASQQAQVVAKNVAAVVEGGVAKEKWKVPEDFYALMALGPDYSAAYVPGMKMGLGLANLWVKQAKAKDGGLTLAMYLKDSM
ncbi:hypothetical protein BC828DRAFT_377581 [Blastocladiella britannica]|nr:hypothetical protein BC828DRAFT_377581 [Blastocladiella britannica]